MKRKLLYLLTIILMIVMLFTLTACGKEKEESKEKNGKGKTSVSYTGKSSPQELMHDFYEDVKWSYKDKAIKYFNLEAGMACSVLEDYDLDFDEVYNMFLDLDKGVSYLKKNYKDVVEAIEDDGVEFDSSVVELLKERKELFKEEGERVIDNLIGYPDSEVDTVELGDNYTNIKDENFGVYDVIIKYFDSESSDTEFDAWIVKIDGKYYLATID